jgi:hypothetical protein
LSLILGAVQVISKSLIARLIGIFALSFLMLASPSYAAKAPKLTPMELQAIQSREFEVPKEVAFGAVMTVIQDLGYTVESADIISGFITASSPTENKTNFFEALGGASSSGNTTMTVFLMQMPNGMTRIRLNFVNSKSMSTAYGRGSRQDKPILDPAVYNNAWERIDEALFVMGALADSSAREKPGSAKESDIDGKVEAENNSSGEAGPKEGGDEAEQPEATSAATP